MIGFFYTGDNRGNSSVMKQNHKKLFDKVQDVSDYKIYDYTKSSNLRISNPFDDGSPDLSYRRGIGGGVQVWDFITSTNAIPENIVVKLRTDVWFTDSAITVFVEMLQDVISNTKDIVYFGSDWLNENAGKHKEVISLEGANLTRIQDFVIVANKSKLKDLNEVTHNLLASIPSKMRSGNKTFRGIIGKDAKAYTVLCHLWLIRKTYETVPTDQEVCWDYIQSYINDGKNDSMIPAVNWWKNIYNDCNILHRC